MAPILRAVLALTLFTALGARPVFAQLDRGQIAGFVKDQSGGVIPGATVTATQHADRARSAPSITDATRLLRVPRPAAGPV